MSLVIALDIVTKIVFLDKHYPFLKGFISIHSNYPDYNKGGSFGILQEHTWLLILISIVFLVFLILFDFKYKPESKVYNIGFSFVVGGAIGNLIDRVFIGGVRDFICFDFWPEFPLFNLADSFLCIGVVLFAIYIIFIHKDKKESKK